MNTTTETEIWKPIPGYDGFYEVSNHGRVRSWKNNKWGRSEKPKIRRLTKYGEGYLYVHLVDADSNSKLKAVHRLVGELHVPNPNNKPILNHLDGDKENNFATNLRWSTYSENAYHAYSTGLRVKEPVNGEENGNSKLVEEEVIEIREIYSTEDISHRELAKMFGVSKTLIGNIVRNEAWTHI